METVAPPGFSEAEVAKHLKRQGEIAAASAVPLPGPLLNAMEPEPVKVCGFTLRPIVLSDIGFLQKIGSPLLKAGEIAARQDATGNGADLNQALMAALTEPLPGETADDAKARLWDGMVESFYILTHPVKEIRKLLAKGRAALNEAAMEEIGDKLPPHALAEIQTALAKHFSDSFSTAIEYAADTGQEGFRLPQARTTTG